MRIAKTFALLSAFCIVPPVTAVADDVATGETLFNNICAHCHSVVEGENKMGPSLFGVVGRHVATAPGYVYSPTMKRADEVWTADELVKYLAEPTEEIPCHHFFYGKGMVDCPNINMTFKGFKDKADAEAVVAYLKTKR